LEVRTLLSTLAVSPNVDISRQAGNEAESTISINPTNPLNLFAGSTVGNLNKYSTDGGLTWRVSTYVGLPVTIGDIQSAWDSFGNLFITYISSTGRDVVARSNDGGATFRDGRMLGTNIDQPSIAVGPSGLPDVPEAVWVSFTDTSGLFAAGAPVMGFDSLGAFHTPVTVPGPGGDFGDIAVGPNGEVLATYQNQNSGIGPDSIKVNLDPTGLGSQSFRSSSVATGTNVGGFATIPAQPSRSIDAEANLAWDRSGGLFTGRVYLVYTDRPSTGSSDTDIYVRYSDDDGTTWSPRVRVNDDPVGNGKSQFNPAMAVDQTTGNVAVTWYDTRHSGSANNTAEVWGTISEDGGNTFLPNVQISQGDSNAAAVDNGFDFGDYDKMDFVNGVFYRTWADNSNSTGDNPNGTSRLDIYTAAVTVVPSTGTVTGVVWNDLDGDGAQEPGEVGLAGWTVFVDLHGDGTLEPDDPQAVTAADGSYAIPGVPLGTWNVGEVLQPSWAQTTPPGGVYSVTLSASSPEADGISFGNQLAMTPTTVVDDADPGFNLSGDGWTVLPGGYNGTHVVNVPTGNPAEADWQVPTVPDTYALFVTWVPDPANAPNATYQVFDDGNFLGAVPVNQQFAASDFLFGGVTWMNLGNFTSTTGNLEVVLNTDGVLGNIDADAVFLAPALGSPTPAPAPRAPRLTGFVSPAAPPIALALETDAGRALAAAVVPGDHVPSQRILTAPAPAAWKLAVAPGGLPQRAAALVWERFGHLLAEDLNATRLGDLYG
jgi:hypothetical protein